MAKVHCFGGKVEESKKNISLVAALAVGTIGTLCLPLNSAFAAPDETKTLQEQALENLPELARVEVSFEYPIKFEDAIRDEAF